MNRKVIASIAALPILFGAMFGATPAMAANGDDPSAAATATVAAPDPVATDAVSTAQDPTPAPTDASTAEPTPEVAPVDEAPSTPAPERPEVAPAPIPTPEPVAAAPPSAPVRAPAKAQAPTSQATHDPGTFKTWYPVDSELPPFWVALKSKPGSPLTDCAVPGDPRIMTSPEYMAINPAGSRSYSVIQWEANQNSGTATFDLAGSTCGARWGITSSDAMWTLSSASGYISIVDGRVTINIDAWDAVRLPGQSYGAWPVYIELGDGSVIDATVGVNHKIAAPVVQSPVAIPYVGEARVGVPFSVTTADLLMGATWSSGDVSTLVRGNLSFSMQPATVNAQGGFDWTPDWIGTYTFHYTLRDPVSGVTTGDLRGTINVTDRPHVSIQPEPYVGTVKVGEKLSVSLEDLVNKASSDGAPATGVWFDPQTFMSGAETIYGASGEVGFTWTPKEPGVYTFAYNASGAKFVLAQTIGTITVTEADPVVVLPPVITPPAALPPVATPTAPKPALSGFTVQTGGTATAGTQSFGWLILTGALALIALTLAFIFASKRGRAWGRGAAIVGLAMVGVCVLGAAAPHNVASAPLDMRGNAVQLEAAAPTSHETPDTTRAVDTGSGRFSAPTVGLDVPLGALTATGGVITPPGFTSAYQVRNVGVDPADAGNGTVFVVMHSLRNGGVGPGNYLIDVEHARAKITTGATITVDGVNYSVTDAKVISKEQLAARADVWANTPGRLVVITCLQTPSNQPSTDNLVITATHKA